MSNLFALLNREKIAMPVGKKTIHRMEPIAARQRSDEEVIALEHIRDAVVRAINEGKHSITGIADHLGETRGRIRHIVVGMKQDGIVSVINVTGRVKTRFYVDLKKSWYWMAE